MKRDYPTDQALWRAFKASDRQALDALFRLYYPPLFRYGTKVCGDSNIAEESLQDFFLYLFQHRKGLSVPKNTQAYLYRAYRRRLLQQLRKDRISRHAKNEFGKYQIDIQFSAQDILINKEDESNIRMTLLNMLNDLPKRQREAIYLRYYSNLNIREVADVLSITYQGTVNTLHKAIKALRVNADLKQIVSTWS